MTTTDNIIDVLDAASQSANFISQNEDPNQLFNRVFSLEMENTSLKNKISQIEDDYANLKFDMDKLDNIVLRVFKKFGWV